MQTGRNEDTQRKFDNAIYRAKRWGLSDGQMKIWEALVEWFEQNPDGPTNRDIVALACVSNSLVYWTIPVLEALGIVTLSRNRKGERISRSIRLWKYPPTEST